MRPFLALAALALAPLAHSQTVALFHDDFESGLSNWTAEAIWHLQAASDPCSDLVTPFPSGTHAAWFGIAGWCHIGGPNQAWYDGSLEQIAPIQLPATTDTMRLTMRSTSEGENDEAWDRRTVWILVDETGNWISLGNLVSSGWQTQSFDLTRWAGHSVRLRLEFWTGDAAANDGFGWFVDDVSIDAISEPGIVFCSGDGTGPQCPCSNFGGAGRGCASATNPQGAMLAASGSASFSNDTLALQASGVTQSLVTFFATSGHETYGWYLQAFGDGLRCTSGTALRVRAFPNAAGMAQIPAGGDVTLGQRFSVTPGNPTRYVQALYRSAGAFCTSSTFNLTNGLIVTWRP